MPWLRKKTRASYQSDQDLLNLYRIQDDMQAYGILFDRYIELVYGVCLKYLKSPEDSEDAVMQTLNSLRDKGHLFGEYRSYLVDRYVWWKGHSDIRRIPIPQPIREKVLSVGVCAHCNTSENLSVDHIIPHIRGGSDEESNLQCLCRSCNCSKRDRFIG